MKFMLIYSLALWNGYGKQFLQEAFLQEDVLAVSIEQDGVSPSSFMSALPHWYIASRIGKRLSPSGVREYSTRGGTTG